jgi:hypothetical protein
VLKILMCIPGCMKCNMTEQNNTKVIMNHNGTRSYQFQLNLNLLLLQHKEGSVQDAIIRSLKVKII